MSNMVRCPNCTQMVTKDSEYCIFCGTKIPIIEEPSFSGPDAAPGARIIKRCKNGHEFEDDSLDYCPLCGVPFEKQIKPEPTPTWRCSCGHDNPIDNIYCEACSHPREPKISIHGESTSPKAETGFIPEGMYTPTPDDLKPKRGRKA